METKPKTQPSLAPTLFRSRILILLMVSISLFLPTACRHFLSPYEPPPPGFLIDLSCSEGGPATFFETLTIYPDSTILRRHGPRQFLRSRLDPETMDRLRGLLAVPSLQTAVERTRSPTCPDGCCDLPVVAFDGVIQTSYSCGCDSPEPEIVALLTLFSEIAEDNFALRRFCSSQCFEEPEDFSQILKELEGTTSPEGDGGSESP